MNVPAPRSVQALNDALLAHPEIADACVLAQHAGGAELVCYVVPRGENLPAGLPAYLSETVPGTDAGAVDLSFVFVAALPLTPAGEPARDVLRALPVLDAALLERAGLLIAHPGTAAFVYQPDRQAPPPLHLASLFPDWQRAGAGQTGTQPSSVAAPPTTGPPSLCLGPPLDRAIAPNLAEAFRHTLEHAPGGTSVYVQEDGSEIVQTYAGLAADATRILAALRALGALPGDCFLFQFRRNQDFVPCFWACVLGGFIPVPLSIAPTYDQPNANISKLLGAWQMLGQPWILTDRALSGSILALESAFGFTGVRVGIVENLREAQPGLEAWHAAQPGDLALLLFTSGSTGKPKAVRQTHRALLSRSAATAQHTGLTGQDRYLNWLPLDHVGGIVMYHLLALTLGAAQVHVPTQSILQAPLQWLDLIEKHRITTTWAPNFAFGLVNAQAEELARRRWDLSRLIFILNAGEAIVARTARHFIQLLLPHGLPATAMRPAWGMSETCSACTYSTHFTLEQTRDSDTFVQVGEPVPEFGFRIVDGSGAVVPEGQIGRLEVRGPSVLEGYDQNPAVNAESFTPDGWFITGDLARVEAGQLSITGRQKDVIIVNGVNFYCHELEALVEEIPGVDVSFTAVCAFREEGAETDSVAVFFHPVHGDEAQLAGLLREIRGRMVRNAGVSPALLLPVAKSQIPKTEIGKVQRAQLQQRLAQGDYVDLLRQVEVLLASANTLPAWSFVPVWQPRQLATATAMLPGSGWLVFTNEADGLDLGEDTIRVRQGSAFAQSGPGLYTLDAADPAHYRQLFAALAEQGFAVRHVLHLWTCGQPEALTAAVPAALTSLLELGRQLASLPGHEPIALTVVSTGAQPIGPDAQASAHAGLPALLRTLAAEEPRLATRHIDFDGAADNARLLLTELHSPASEPEVAYRDGERLVPRLLHASPVARHAAADFTPGGAYLLTGGLGGIGLELARALVTRYGARLLLAGRTALAEPPQALLALQAAGDVRYAALDIADASAVSAAVEQAEQAWGRPLDGILHLAAAYHDGSLERETTATFTAALHAKVGGALALETLFAARPHLFLVGFSSVLSQFPGALVGAYAVANRMLESLCAGLHARGYKACAVAWSSWRDTGMSAGQSAREALRAKGILEMSAEEGFHTLRLALRLGRPLLAVGLDAGNLTIRRRAAGLPVALERMTLVYTADDAAAGALAAQPLADRFGTPIALTATPLAKLPLTAAGEVDREALLLTLRRGAAQPAAEPATETERRIRALWQELLKAPHLGVEDNFFMLGGHSLLATRVISRLRALFAVEVPLRSLFDTPTVRGLAQTVDVLLTSSASGELPLEPAAGDVLPLSFTQQRLWFLEQMQPGLHVYNVPLIFRLRGAVDPVRLQSALDALVARHASLRTTFEQAGGHAAEPVQRIHAHATVPLRQLAGGDLHDAFAQETRRPFDLSRDVLLRALLIRAGEAESYLVLTLHHIAADGWSLDLLFRELTALYTGQPPLDPLPIRFADYAAWQRRTLTGPALDRQAAYWSAQLHGLPPLLKLPTDLPRPATQSFRGALHPFTLPPRLGTAVAELCHAEQVTPFIALLTVLQVLLRHYTRTADIAVGCPIANRTRMETDGLIGFFANTLVFRTVFPPDPTFRQLLGRVREVALGAYAHQEMPFEKLVELLKPARAGYNPIFQVNFRVVTQAPAELRLGSVLAERMPFDPASARFDLSLELLFTAGRFEGYFEYATDLFYPATIRRMEADFQAFLSVLCLHPEQPLSTLDLGRHAGVSSAKSAGGLRRRTARATGAAATLN